MIQEEQTKQWSKEKGQKDKLLSMVSTYKKKHHKEHKSYSSPKMKKSGLIFFFP